ncbi:MAG: hypothetical protein V1678_02180 [Candidatus Aenigmatarchaeota archaeon]
MKYPTKISKVSLFGNLAELELIQWERWSKSAMKELLKVSARDLKASRCRVLALRQNLIGNHRPCEELTQGLKSKRNLHARKDIKVLKKLHSTKKRAICGKVWNIAM